MSFPEIIKPAESIPSQLRRKPIYLDHNATTPCDPRVSEVVVQFLSEKFGNVGSRLHAFGWEAEAAVQTARRQIAQLIHAQPGEIVFTSGATESNNLAIKGVVATSPLARKHVIVSNAEHKSVLEVATWLQGRGCAVTFLPVDREGRVSPEQVAAALRPDTVLVSLIHGNNEVGVLNDIAAIGRVCANHGVLFHTDGSQSCGKVPVDVNDLQVDLMSLSGHKMYGPKGVGALYVRTRVLRQRRVAPEQLGGGQEQGLRAGTLPVHQIVGFGRACEIAHEELGDEMQRMAALRDRLLAELQRNLQGVHVNGGSGPRVPGNLNVSFEDVDPETLIGSLQHFVALSTGSACASPSLKGSQVLLNMGLEPELASSSLRLCVGRFTTEQDITEAAQRIIAAVHEARAELAGRERGNDLDGSAP